MRSRLGTIALVCTVVASVGITVAGPVTADPTRRVLAAAKDRPHDVVITRDRGLPTAQRRSVELKRLVVTQRQRKVRFALTVGRVDRSTAFAQVYLIDLTSPGYDFTQLMVATQSMSEPPSSDGLEHDIGIEGTGTPQGFVACDDLPISLRDGANRWWVEVPRRCLPAGPVKISVYAQAVNILDAESGVFLPKQFSHDRLRVPGRHDLHGTAKPAYTRS